MRKHDCDKCVEVILRSSSFVLVDSSSADDVSSSTDESRLKYNYFSC